MKSEIKKLEKSQVEIIIEVAPDETKPFLEKAVGRLAQKVNFEGFRPGKAPYEMVKQKVGDMAIMEEAADEIIAKTYFNVLKENNIISVGQPKIDIEKMAPDNPFVYKATVAVLPKIKIGDYQKIKIARKKIEVKPEEIDKVILDIQKMRATEKLIDREAKPEDRLEIDFDIFVDKVAIEHGRQKKYPITIGEGRFIPGFEEQLIGLKAGEIKEFELKFPDSYYQKNLAGKKAEFKVKCNAVYEVNAPELNDNFALEISHQQFKNFQELKDNIKKNLEEEQKHKEERRLEAEIFDKIIEVSDFEELPDILIHGEAHKMIQEIEHNIESQGLKFDDYLKGLNKTEEDLEKELMPEAEKRVKSSLVAKEIYQENKFEVSEEEIKQEMAEVSKHYPADANAREQFESESYKDYIRNSLGNRKVVEYLKKIIIE
ncbi:MAG: trigger factor [Patescibacteria group bacterium]